MLHQGNYFTEPGSINTFSLGGGGCCSVTVNRPAHLPVLTRQCGNTKPIKPQYRKNCINSQADVNLDTHVVKRNSQLVCRIHRLVLVASTLANKTTKNIQYHACTIPSWMLGWMLVNDDFIGNIEGWTHVLRWFVGRQFWASFQLPWCEGSMFLCKKSDVWHEPCHDI